MENWICMLGGHKEPREITGFRAEDGLLIGRCPRCGGPVISRCMRVSTWLRDDVAIAACLEELRRKEGDSVTLMAENPRWGGSTAVVVCGEWTGWKEKRFEGETLLAALQAAVANRPA